MISTFINRPHRLNIFLPVLASVAMSIAAASAGAQTAPATHTASILDFGAKADGETLNTAAIQTAIDSLASQGGGTLTIPDAAGKAFLSGALFLKPGVNLHLDKNAILKGSTDVKDYPTLKTRVEGHFQDWLPALINAVETDNVRIDGEGTLDGSGTPFYAAFRAARTAVRGTKNLDVPRPRLIFIQKSKNVTVAGINLLNSGFWNLHLYNCDGVTVDGLDIRAAAGSPSTDGIDVDSSRNVAITNTFISNNDDCIALKGSKGPFAMQDKDSPPVEHIRVSNCTFAMGGSLVTCGSEGTIVRDVVVENCTIAGPNTRGISMLRLKLRTDTPQLYEDIHYKNITLDGVGTIITVASWSQYEDPHGPTQTDAHGAQHHPYRHPRNLRRLRQHPPQCRRHDRQHRARKFRCEADQTGASIYRRDQPQREKRKNKRRSLHPADIPRRHNHRPIKIGVGNHSLK